MKKTETLRVQGKEREYTVRIHSCGEVDTIIVYLTMPCEEAELDGLYSRAGEVSGHPAYALAAVEITEWNDELSPWECRKTEAKLSFAGNGERFLADLEQVIFPEICGCLGAEPGKVYTAAAGYSLAGLFSLWALYRTEIFRAAISCSGSLWYPDFLTYASEHSLPAGCDIYLSLGKKEEQVRNPYMAKVGDATRELYERYRTDDEVAHSVLEWNAGNHFKETSARTAKGMAWLLSLRNL